MWVNVVGGGLKLFTASCTTPGGGTTAWGGAGKNFDFFGVGTTGLGVGIWVGGGTALAVR